MECPHCFKSIYVKDRTYFNFSSNFDGSALLTYIGVDASGYWWLEKIVCPACQQFILTLVLADETDSRERPSSAPPPYPYGRYRTSQANTSQAYGPTTHSSRGSRGICFRLSGGLPSTCRQPQSQRSLESEMFTTDSQKGTVRRRAGTSTKKYSGRSNTATFRRPLLSCSMCRARLGTRRLTQRFPTLA